MIYYKKSLITLSFLISNQQYPFEWQSQSIRDIEGFEERLDFLIVMANSLTAT